MIGAGAWGTALAMVARRAGRNVVLQAHEPVVADAINGIAPYPMTDEEIIATPALWEAAITSVEQGTAVDV
ncbi:MAG: hypothetical protein COC02_03820 [Rhodospirillaceae bacterium]|nr:MAG: hypothetical protein COC02_03820 [Rhodospirillaceae bacterium]